MSQDTKELTVGTDIETGYLLIGAGDFPVKRLGLEIPPNKERLRPCALGGRRLSLVMAGEKRAPAGQTAKLDIRHL